MSIPVYRTWANGEVVTAAQLNTEIRDNGVLTWTPIGAKVISAVQSIPNNAVTKIAAFATESWDSDAFHVAASDNLTIPVGYGGMYMIGWYGLWDGHADSNNRRMQVYKNGASILTDNKLGGNVLIAHFANYPVLLADGDILTLYSLQDSGVALNLNNPTLWIWRMK